MFSLLTGLWLGLSANAAALEPASPAPTVIKREIVRVPQKSFENPEPGEARVRLVLDGNGLVTHAEIVDDVPAGHGYGRELLRSVKTWTFAAIPGTYEVTYHFRLAKHSHVEPPAELPPSAPPPTKTTPAVVPPLAVVKNIEGKAELIIRIASGRVKSGVVLKDEDLKYGSSLFGDAALTAVLKWRYESDVHGLYLETVTFDAEALAAGKTTIRR